MLSTGAHTCPALSWRSALATLESLFRDLRSKCIYCLKVTVTPIMVAPPYEALFISDTGREIFIPIFHFLDEALETLRG